MGKIKILMLLVSVFFMSCNMNSESATQKNSANNKPNTSTKKEVDNNEIYTYKSATVYAGSTDYKFLDKDKKEVVIRLSNFPEEAHKNIRLSKNMLESNKEIEGPPAENPALVNSEFIVIRNEVGEIVELKLKD